MLDSIFTFFLSGLINFIITRKNNRVLSLVLLFFKPSLIYSLHNEKVIGLQPFSLI